MKKHIDGVLVVEGKSDVSFLSNYLDAEFVITNGSAISDDTVNYLKEASKTKKIYVLTDPDFPGKKIRDVLDECIQNLNHCFISKEKSIKHGKVGVAEGDINEILEALDNAISVNNSSKNTISSYDLLSLGLLGEDDSSDRRNQVSTKLHLGYCNAKTLLKRLNYLGITKEELKKIL